MTGGTKDSIAVWCLGAGVVFSLCAALLVATLPLVRCNQCAGTCDRCQGAGVVESADGTTRIARCPQCAGRGSSVLFKKASELQTCATCGGEGMPSFRPTDTTICDDCQGSGTLLPGPGEAIPIAPRCSRCDGNRRLTLLRSRIP